MKRWWGFSLILIAGVGVASERQGGHWSYSGEGGPAAWGKLGFADCNGKNQSPIDLTRANPATLDPIAFAYRAGAAKVLNNGHALQFQPANVGGITVGGVRYELIQFHFHGPSEHLVDGDSYPLELHLVHRNAAGRLAVVGVLVEEGEEGAVPLLERFPELPAAMGQEVAGTGEIDPAGLLPANHDYRHYMGSLTTPPCTEGVTWLVLTTPVVMSAAHIGAIAQLHPANARPVQILNMRNLFQLDGAGDGH